MRGPCKTFSRQMYLMKYGYMDHHHKSNKSAPLLSRDGLRDYVAKFQGFAGKWWLWTCVDWWHWNKHSLRTSCDRRAGQDDSEAHEAAPVRGQGRCGEEHGIKQEQAIRFARLKMESEHIAVQNFQVSDQHWHVQVRYNFKVPVFSILKPSLSFQSWGGHGNSQSAHCLV